MRAQVLAVSKFPVLDGARETRARLSPDPARARKGLNPRPSRFEENQRADEGRRVQGVQPATPRVDQTRPSPGGTLPPPLRDLRGCAAGLDGT